jgi:hypothetical protein
MNAPDKFADEYVQLWNETDPSRRAAAIARLWIPQGRHFVRTLEASGYEQLEQRVAGSHEKNVRDRGFRFRRAGSVQALQDSLMFHWEMVPAGTDAVAALGLEFLLLAPDGRIRTDYQFVLPTPAA